MITQIWLGITITIVITTVVFGVYLYRYYKSRQNKLIEAIIKENGFKLKEDEDGIKTYERN